MDLKLLGAALAGLGSVAALSVLRSRSSSLAEEAVPETQRAIPPEVVHRYDRAYSKFLQSKRAENYYESLRNVQKLREAREKVLEALEDVSSAEQAMEDSHKRLDKINFQSEYVDDIADTIALHEPRDLARMKAYGSFVRGLDSESARKFAELAGEPSLKNLLERWAR